MSNKNTEDLWSAYLDGELSISEAQAFENSLSSEEKKQLEKEVKFESVLQSQMLDVKCPDELWGKLKAQLQTEEQEVKVTKKTFTFPRKAWIALAAILCIGFAVTQTLIARSRLIDTDLFAVAASLESLHAETEVKGDFQDIESYLREHQVNLAFDKDSFGHHPTKAMGISKDFLHGEEVYNIHVNCCGKPMKILVTCQGNAACKEMFKAFHRGKAKGINAMGTKGKYRIAVIGHHDGSSLLNSMQIAGL